eukprot:5099828-Lingulodinium_polyedra.AAC.1
MDDSMSISGDRWADWRGRRAGCPSERSGRRVGCGSVHDLVVRVIGGEGFGDSRYVAFGLRRNLAG